MNVYDFDNTIYDGESAVDFFLFYIRRDPSLLKYAPRFFAAIAKYKRGKISIEQALRDYGGEVSEYYKNMADADDAIKAFWDTHEKNIKSFYKEVHRPDDLVISASPEISLAEICARLDIKNFIGTAIDKQSGEITRLCFRENKVKAYFEVYGNTPIDCFYTDSLNDKPLIDISENAFLVKKNKITKIK